jgi:hypothetical protein
MPGFRLTKRAVNMKKSLLIIALIVIVAGTFNIFFGPETQDSKQNAKLLPWQIEITPQGNTRVFDIEVGVSNVQQISQLWRVSPEIALFRDPDGSHRLESYLGKIKLGPFQARIILNLQANKEQLANFAKNSSSHDATPSGSHQLRLSKDDFELALQMPINELSYSPAVDTEVEMLSNLFGTPEREILIDDNSSYWLYPQRGLVILINDEDKDVFHYFPPRDYEDILQVIEQLKQAKAEIPAAEGSSE